MQNERPVLLSLDDTQRIIPDHDYPSTADNLHWYGCDSHDPCFTLQSVAPADIDPGQLIDDPDDHDGWRKVESIRETLRTGGQIPPVYLRHTRGEAHPYYLFEGRHRYNAAHAEAISSLTAWVAHIECCDLGNANV